MQALLCCVPHRATCANRYIESIEDVMNVFIRLHLTSIAPHVVIVDDLSTLHARDKMCLPCSPSSRLTLRSHFCLSAAATVAVLCNALEWIQKTNRSSPLAVICDATDAQGSSSMYRYFNARVTLSFLTTRHQGLHHG